MSKRTPKLAELIRHYLSEIIAREVELPAGVLVTITKVEVSGDLKYAKVWLAVTPEEKVGVAYGSLREQSKELQRLLTEKVDLQFAPFLRFRVDRSAMAVEEVERLLREIRNEK